MSKKTPLKIITNILNVLMITITFFLTLYYINILKYERLFSCLSLFVIVFFPNIFNNTKYKLNDKYRFIYASFIFFALFLGCCINLYEYISWYDLFLHFISGTLSVVLALYILEKNGNIKIRNKLVRFIYLVGTVSLIALLWEMFEYAGDVLFNMNSQHNLETGVNDTMQDVIIAFIGGIVGYLILLITEKTNRKKLK